MTTLNDCVRVANDLGVAVIFSNGEAKIAEGYL